MKKSEILKVLGDYTVNYYVENILNEDLLVVEVEALDAYHLLYLSGRILFIDLTENKTLKLYFSCKIELD